MRTNTKTWKCLRWIRRRKGLVTRTEALKAGYSDTVFYSALKQYKPNVPSEEAGTIEIKSLDQANHPIAEMFRRLRDDHGYVYIHFENDTLITREERRWKV